MIESEMAESVDTIRFIKTNRPFYKKLVLLWLKFRAAHYNRILAGALLTDEFAKFAAAKLQLAPSQQLNRVVAFTAKIFVEETARSIAEEVQDELTECTYFANVKSALLFHWEASVVAKSAQFRNSSSL